MIFPPKKTVHKNREKERKRNFFAEDSTKPPIVPIVKAPIEPTTVSTAIELTTDSAPDCSLLESEGYTCVQVSIAQWKWCYTFWIHF